VIVKDPLMVVSKASRKRESICVRFRTCLPTSTFTISIRLWKEPFFGKRSVVSLATIRPLSADEETVANRSRFPVEGSSSPRREIERLYWRC